MSIVDLFTAGQAWASAAEVEHHAPSINGIWFPLINFSIFAFIIVRFAVPPVRDYLRSRRQEVVTTLETAAESKRRASAVVQDYRWRLAHLDEQVQSLQNSLRAEGERQSARLLQDAEALALKIKADARFLADQEVKIARQTIREEMAQQAASHARELIERAMSAADQRRLIDDFIQNIGQAR
jgi:F-type H+-transporting ATPase subunit b